MLYEDFKQLRIGESFIICHERHNDMPGGWNESMDTLLGTPLLVLNKNQDFVCTKHPNGSTYAFHYGYVEVYKEIQTFLLSWRGKKFEAVKKVNFNILSTFSLDEDMHSVLKNIKLENKQLILSSDCLDSLQKYCPRIVGVLLSNNYLKECK